MKLTKTIATIAVISLMVSTTAFAGTWKTGSGANQNKWWYDNEDGTYANNGWQWIDGNKDGKAECYYFDESGWMLSNTIVDSDSKVNKNGAWVKDGVAQTIKINTDSEERNWAPAQNMLGQYYTGEVFWDAGGYNTMFSREKPRFYIWINSITNKKVELIESTSNGSISETFTATSAPGVYVRKATYGNDPVIDALVFETYTDSNKKDILFGAVQLKLSAFNQVNFDQKIQSGKLTYRMFPMEWKQGGYRVDILQ